jgi:hypothetical protein
MEQKTAEPKEGAVVSYNQLMLMQQFFRLNPWSYVYTDPFKTAQELEEMEADNRKISTQ